MTEDPVTIWAIKLKNRGRWQQMVVLLKILLVIAAIMVAMATIQVKLCHDDYPHKTVLECVRG